MTKRTTLIAGAAIFIAGTAGIAGWLVADANEILHADAQMLTAAPAPGVAETEGVVTAPQGAAAPQPLVAEPLIGSHAPVPVATARAERASRTPITAPPAAEPARAERAETAPVEPAEPRNLEPARDAVLVPAAPRAVEVLVPAGTVLGVRLTSGVTSENAELEDRVEATVTRDVIADGRVAIPSGTRLLGSVNEVTRGGKFKERARLGIRFHTLVLGDGTRETVRVDAIVREGDSPARESVAKIGGGTIGGAIIGGIMGGKKGALLGGAAGAGAGTAAVVASDRSIAAIASGTPLSVRLDAPVKVTIERD